MSTATATTTVKVAKADSQQQADRLGALAVEVAGTASLEGIRTFSPNKVTGLSNTGLYASRIFRRSEATALGIAVPPGGKVKVQVTVIVVDPEVTGN